MTVTTSVHRRAVPPSLPETTKVEAAVNPKRWLILAVLGLAQLMVVLDATIVNIALPQAQHDLAFSNGDRQWIVTAYALAFGSLLLLGGRLSDLFGRRTTFLVGLVGFATASAIGGAASDVQMLIAARAGQGIFGALLAPAALSLLTLTFTDPAERGKAFGIFGAIAGGGGALGLLLGGSLTEWADWRWCLYVNLVIAAIAFVGAFALLAKQKSDHRPKLDIPGTVVVSSALFGIVYGFSQAESEGWTAPVTLSWLLGGVALLGVFGYLQARVSNPLLPLRIIADRTRAGSFLTVFITGTGLFACFLFVTYYMQVNLGYSPIKTGLAFMPMILGLVFTATRSAAIALPRFGPRLPMTVGMLFSAAGMAYMTRITLDSSYVTDIMPALILVGMGVGAATAPAMQGAVSGVQQEDAGVASAMVNTMQQIGGSIGTALLSTVAATAAASYMEGKAASPLVAALAAVESYTTVFWWASGIFATGAVVAAVVVRKGLLPAAPEGTVVVGH
ncbi:MFS transporter [Antrihabitans sp. YC2-6]|uniref:MFS transporter n=1 Tax=Antrihabitans sp. YC2-6 TaxID=2799498 RepID=UPI0018F63073|nr:MFS transporter [Antrihabitans sp. YC2-6]MBJ8347245.1 MFS transporter [Antrihabitans sp. YC2-6]